MKTITITNQLKWGVFDTEGNLIKGDFKTKLEARKYAIQYTNIPVWDIVGYREELYYNIGPVIEFKRRNFDIGDNSNN